jgi:drug/metabolite transporter (DMT)-like permease
MSISGDKIYFMASHHLALPALILASIIGGGGGIAIKLALFKFGPFTLLFLRFLFASILISPLIITRFPRLTSHFLRFSVLLSAFFAGNVLLYVIGIQWTTAITATLMYTLTPIILAILTHYRRRQETVTSTQWLGFIFGIIGTAIIIFRSFFSSQDILLSVGTPKGNLFILAAVISYSLFLYFSQVVSRHYQPLALTSINFYFTALVASFFSFWEISYQTAYQLPLTSISLGALTYIILFLTLAMYFLYQWGIKHSSSLTAGSTIYLGPLVATALAIPLLGERITPHLALGGMLILLGVYLANRRAALT